MRDSPPLPASHLHVHFVVAGQSPSGALHRELEWLCQKTGAPVDSAGTSVAGEPVFDGRSGLEERSLGPTADGSIPRFSAISQQTASDRELVHRRRQYTWIEFPSAL